MGEQIKYKGRICGYVSGDTYFSPRKPKDFCYKFSGWAIQTEIMAQLEQMGIQYICIKINDGRELWQTLQGFKAEGFIAVLHRKEGEQWFCPECVMYYSRKLLWEALGITEEVQDDTPPKEMRAYIEGIDFDHNNNPTRVTLALANVSDVERKALQKIYEDQLEISIRRK